MVLLLLKYIKVVWNGKVKNIAHDTATKQENMKGGAYALNQQGEGTSDIEKVSKMVAVKVKELIVTVNSLAKEKTRG